MNGRGIRLVGNGRRTSCGGTKVITEVLRGRKLLLLAVSPSHQGAFCLQVVGSLIRREEEIKGEEEEENCSPRVAYLLLLLSITRRDLSSAL